MARRIRLDIEYDGTDFRGWQLQGGGEPGDPPDDAVRTVQGEIEKALKTILRTGVRIAGCSRTDVGVHALGQVAHFDWPEASAVEPLTCDRLRQALNSVLPQDVAIRAVAEVGEDFHAQVSATGKIYRYLIHARKDRHPLRRRSHWHVRYALDAEAMRAAAQHLIGAHDLTSFANELDTIQQRRSDKGMDPLETVRTIRRIDVERPVTDEIVITVEGSGFLYKMVRTIVGTLVEVGRGKQPPEWVRQVRDLKDRRHAGPTAAAKGLTLMKILY